MMFLAWITSSFYSSSFIYWLEGVKMMFIAPPVCCFTALQCQEGLQSNMAGEEWGLTNTERPLFVSSRLLLRDELHPRVRRPLSAGLLLPVQLGDAPPGQPLGVDFPKPVGNCVMGVHLLPAVQEEIFLEDMKYNSLPPVFSAINPLHSSKQGSGR